MQRGKHDFKPYKAEEIKTLIAVRDWMKAVPADMKGKQYFEDFIALCVLIEVENG